MTTTLVQSPLSAAERCDRCGAQAYVRVVLESGGDLLFCGHHSTQYEQELRKIAIEFQDERARITENP